MKRNQDIITQGKSVCCRNPSVDVKKVFDQHASCKIIQASEDGARCYGSSSQKCQFDALMFAPHLWQWKKGYCILIKIKKLWNSFVGLNILTNFKKIAKVQILFMEWIRALQDNHAPLVSFCFSTMKRICIFAIFF